MRKILLVLFGCLVALSAVAEEEVLDIVERQTQKVKDECYKSAFPEEKMDKILSLTKKSVCIIEIFIGIYTIRRITVQ